MYSVIVRLDTLRSYISTNYRVDAEGGSFVLRVGEHSEAIRELHKRVGVSSSVFITSCNPFGAECTDEVNAKAMEGLCRHLNKLGIVWFHGEGQGSDGLWPAESSILALGVSQTQARELCAKFDQNAVVAISEDSVPRLLLHPGAAVVGDSAPHS